MAFSLNAYPVSYRARWDGKNWGERFIEKPYKSPAEEAALPEAEREALINARNCFDDVPLVSYTTQYGMGCFEGIKALPQIDGSIGIFRPDQNAERFHNSMKGLYMEPFPASSFVAANIELIKRNAKLGFVPEYNKAWEKDNWMSADSVYIRPFSYTEGAVGVGISSYPQVIIVDTTVSGYFNDKLSGAVITDRIRATPNGTGWIKAASNYVISALAKHEAAEQGFMECIYLDSIERKYIEEGSSCNIFFYLKSGELVTPALGDTILPGITRKSIIELARDKGTKVSERKISIDEVISETRECFVSGTAAGATAIDALTYKGKKTVFPGGKLGPFTADIQNTLKGIQFGAIPDTKGWVVKIER
jgi:branched-chain amino acid aminotransferase